MFTFLVGPSLLRFCQAPSLAHACSWSSMLSNCRCKNATTQFHPMFIDLVRDASSPPPCVFSEKKVSCSPGPPWGRTPLSISTIHWFFSVHPAFLSAYVRAGKVFCFIFSAHIELFPALLHVDFPHSLLFLCTCLVPKAWAGLRPIQASCRGICAWLSPSPLHGQGRTAFPRPLLAGVAGEGEFLTQLT